MRCFMKTDVGRVREINEDCCEVKYFDDGSCLLVLCDGMGGKNGGEIASSKVMQTLIFEFSRRYDKAMSDTAIKAALVSSARTANIAVYDIACADDNLRGMGTTLVAAFIRGADAHIIHAGDSRAYIYSDNALNQITTDHSIVQHLIELGQISKEEANTHPRKNIITRALGVDESIDVEYTFLDIPDKSILLLCTDGVSNMITDKELEQIIQNNTFDDLVDIIIETALNNGGVDNATIIVAEQ
ncbi:MAG: Stp1/IreP family PP2C-type Ser/Thr phosphatase [Acutalibacteraceae bacterium]|nr:Stp1/IreP family PP2C-type Ser/Thr phosphatase [Acutalibacteraceae bacterium]